MIAVNAFDSIACTLPYVSDLLIWKFEHRQHFGYVSRICWSSDIGGGRFKDHVALPSDQDHYYDRVGDHRDLR